MPWVLWLVVSSACLLLIYEQAMYWRQDARRKQREFRHREAQRELAVLAGKMASERAVRGVGRVSGIADPPILIIDDSPDNAGVVPPLRGLSDAEMDEMNRQLRKQDQR